MLILKNESQEPYVIEYFVATPSDERTLRRLGDLSESDSESYQLDPGKEVELLGYTPGVLLRVRPLHDAELPRPGFRTHTRSDEGIRRE